MPEGPMPLQGIRVLEFGQIAAGPFAGSLLADLGADVVKIERPDGGDGMRAWPPLSSAADDSSDVYSENFASLNRNKRSVALDLKDPDDVTEVRRLVAAADVLIENYRAGVLERLGLGFETLQAINPALVYCSISGYGQTGPYAAKGAFDVTVQAMSGIMSVTGEPDGAPVKCGVPVGDFCAGLYASFTIVSSVLAARQGGKGVRIDCSMLGSLLGVAALQTSEYFGTGQAPRAMGSAHPRNAPYQAFEAKDAHFVLAAGNDRLWAQVCEAVDKPALADDPLYLSQSLRARHQRQLLDELAPVFRRHGVAHWLEVLDRRGVPCSPITDYPAILDDPHVESMRIVAPLTLPNGVRTSTTIFPVAIDGARPGVRRAPPVLGEHNDEVLEHWCRTL